MLKSAAPFGAGISEQDSAVLAKLSDALVRVAVALTQRVAQISEADIYFVTSMRAI